MPTFGYTVNSGIGGIGTCHCTKATLSDNNAADPHPGQVYVELDLTNSVITNNSLTTPASQWKAAWWVATSGNTYSGNTWNGAAV